MVVTCDQDYKPDLNPRPLTEPESNTPTITATSAATMSTTTDTTSEDTTANRTKTSTNAAMNASVSEIWYLKPVTFSGKRVRVITQNFNGSVSEAYRNTAALMQVIECLTFLPQPMLIYSDL